MKKLQVNEDCIGCGVCMGIAQDLFDYTDGGTSMPIDGALNEDNMKLAQDAIDSCPVGAISFVEVSDEESSEPEEEMPKAA